MKPTTISKYALLIDYELASKILPEKVVAIMKHFNVQLFDISKWTQKHEPDLGSFFMYGEGGSYDFKDPLYGEVYITNGTLATVDNIDMGGYSQKYYDYIDGLGLH